MSHAPKQLALEAYADELLSPAGRRRVEAHLAGCADCRAGLAAVRAYALLREQAAAAPAQAPSWEQLERALAAAERADQAGAQVHDIRPGVRERAEPAAPGQAAAAREPARGAAQAAKPAARRAATGPARSGRVIALAWPVLAIAATLLIGWLGLSGAPPDAAPRAQQTPARPVEPALSGRVTLVAGAARLEQGGHSQPVDLRSQIGEGSLLVTERGASLHVALGPDTGFVLGPESRLRVLELRPLRTRLELLAGSVASRVHKLPSDPAQGAYYRVLSEPLLASVRGTRFTVERVQNTRVSVHEGLVEVARGGQVLALLSPGQSYSDAPAGGRAPGETPADTTPADAAIHELARAFEPLLALHLPPLPQLRSWRIDGAAVSAQGELSMRMPAGRAQLSFEDVRGQVRSLEIDVSEAETRIDPLWLAKQVAPKEPARSGYLEPAQIAQVIRAGLDPLRRCYERSLRTRPALEAKLTLAVRVAPDGRVQRAEAHGAGQLPQELEQCIAREAGRLLFPKPDGGGSMSFEVPLNLKAK